MSSVGFDSTIPFLREGYSFVSSRCDALNTDLFTSRIGLRPATFIRGAEAAELFYDKNHFTRQGAMPPTVVHLLQDQGSVQALDGDAHRQRKRAFLDLMSDAAMQRLGDILMSTGTKQYVGCQPISMWCYTKWPAKSSHPHGLPVVRDRS